MSTAAQHAQQKKRKQDGNQSLIISEKVENSCKKRDYIDDWPLASARREIIINILLIFNNIISYFALFLMPPSKVNAQWLSFDV